jgi:hypothetical protein
VDNLEWIEEEHSGHLKAEGIRAQYWIMEFAWVYLESVTVDAAGANIKKHGAFESVEEAKAMAEIYDTSEALEEKG